MQLVEGPTFADRIKAGPIPVDEAVRIAKQIADAPVPAEVPAEPDLVKRIGIPD